MGSLHGSADHVSRRFVVLADAVHSPNGLFRCGDVVTDLLLGAPAVPLLDAGAVRESDYDLACLFDDIDNAPRE